MIKKISPIKLLHVEKSLINHNENWELMPLHNLWSKVGYEPWWKYQFIVECISIRLIAIAITYTWSFNSNQKGKNVVSRGGRKLPMHWGKHVTRIEARCCFLIRFSVNIYQFNVIFPPFLYHTFEMDSYKKQVFLFIHLLKMLEICS